MGITLHWFLPTSGDSRNVVPGLGGHGRPASLEYLGQIARAADHLGFDAVLTPTGTHCEDAWLVTMALSQHTSRLRFLVAFRPGITNPTLAAQQAATFQRLTGGRLLINIVTGGDTSEQQRFGDWLSHDERYVRTDEFLAILRGAWSGSRTTSAGGTTGSKVRRCNTLRIPSPRCFSVVRRTRPRMSPPVTSTCTCFWGEPPDMVRERIERVRAKAEPKAGAPLRNPSPRDHPRTEAEAWREADRLLATMDPALVSAAQQLLSKSESVGQQRMLSLHGGDRSDLEVSPNLWAGIGLVRPGAGTALVGSHEQVAERIAEYHELGLDEFILSAIPIWRRPTRLARRAAPAAKLRPEARANEATAVRRSFRAGREVPGSAEAAHAATAV